MEIQEQLRQSISMSQDRLRATVPPDRQSAILALLRARELRHRSTAGDAPPDLVTGRRIAGLGSNLALHLCLNAGPARDRATSIAANAGLDTWAARFLQESDHLAEATMVLGHCETGFMRIVGNGSGLFDAWIATKQAPAGWIERADFDWWAASLARRYAPELDTLRAEMQSVSPGTPERDGLYRQAAVHLKMMDYQLGYPPDARIGDCTIQTYCDVLTSLIARTLRARDHGELVIMRARSTLVAEIASDLAIDPILVDHALTAFTLDRDNAAYHASVPGIAAAPLVRINPDTLAWSRYGLTAEPLLFLVRELRRRDAQTYHNASYLREIVFRQDLYALFSDTRFVTSANRIELRWNGGKIRTDIDAVIFDRKTGTLGLFELKSQDPFARSTAELTRQRDNILHANRQVSGMLDWLNRHGADDLLTRVDARTARRFRVQKIAPFVLGRYLAHFSGGPPTDRRVAWATWPQFLRAIDRQPHGTKGDANPLASLFARLGGDDPFARPPTGDGPREIVIGDDRIIVHPSYAAFQTSSRTSIDLPRRP